MADNLTLNAGSGGATLATDEDTANSRHVPYSKIMFGADGTFNIVASTASNPLPVALSDTDNTVLDNIQTAVEKIDNPVLVDDAAFTPATSSVMVVGFVFDDTTPDSVDEGDTGAARMSSRRELYVQLRDAAGNERGLNVDASGNITVNAAQSGTWNITNISGTVSLPTGAATAANQSTANTALSAIQTAVELIDDAVAAEAAALGKGILLQADDGTDRINVAADTSGHLQVDLASGVTLVDSHTADFDSSGLVISDRLAFGIILPADGGPVIGGTSTNPLRVDPTGTTIQPVSGTVTANAGTGTFTVANGGTFAVQVDGTALTRLTDIETNTDFGVVVGGGVEATALRVTIASDSTGVLSVDDNGGSLTIDNAALSVTGGGVEASALRVTLASDSTGVVSVDDNGSTLSVDDGASSLTVDVPAVTTGGATPYSLVSAASTNATSVKASAGTVYGIQVYNTNASARYLKLYNKASAPTVGTDTPVKRITIPGNSAGAGSNVPIPVCGVAFDTGIAFALTTGAADSDTGAVAASEILVNIDYK